MFWFDETIIREPVVCALLKSQHWCQLKYFVIKVFGHVAAYAGMQKCHGPGHSGYWIFLWWCL